MKRELTIGEVAGAAVLTPVTLEADLLTTHGVILGMTGSGKTGMAVVVLEELARQHVPLVVCDLKGDLTNLLLAFPDLAPERFAPYVPVAQAGEDRAMAAAAIATRWREGLARWGLGADQIRSMKEGVSWRLLTPGSGVAPVDILPALAAPPGWDPDVDPDGARARLDGTTAAILALVGRGGDPLTDRDHVLVATLLDHAWRSGRDLDLAGLLRDIAEPPVARFGVLDTETFYPRKERQPLVLELNTLLASPAFTAWTRGVPLTMESLIGADGAPKATILYLAHLGDRERMSFLTLLFSTVLSWARSQPGSESLRTLLYIDEVQGIAPPSANPPTKSPLLTLFKQGRAFGAGVLVATQNPVDIDYKALGNAGLKLVGRLDTDNDRHRALEGLELAGAELDATVAGLEKRQFLLAGARVGAPRVMASRWAMSYLRGPLTLAELKPLVAGDAAPRPAAATPEVAAQGPLLPGVRQVFGSGGSLAPAVVIRAQVTVRKASPQLFRQHDGAWIAPLERDRIAWDRLRPLEEPAWRDAPDAGARLADLPANAADLVRGAAAAFAGEMDSRPIEVLWHRAAKLVQEEGESAEQFRNRCRDAMTGEFDAKRSQIRARFEAKLVRVDERRRREESELAADQQDLAAREREKQLTIAQGVGDVLMSGLSALLGGRRRNVGSAVRRGASTMRQVQTRDRMADHARAEVDESQQTLTALAQERARLESELDAALGDLDDQAAAVAAQVETLTVSPSRKDIDVRDVTLAWVAPEVLA